MTNHEDVRAQESDESNGRHNKVDSTLGLCVFFIFWTLVLIYFDGMMTYCAWMQWQTVGFVETNGTVRKQTIETSSGVEASTQYFPVVIYSYPVGGKIYENHVRVPFFYFPFNSRSKAQQKLDETPVGSSITVYYDPRHPQSASLYQGVHGATVQAGIFLILFHVIAIIGWTCCVRRWMPQSIPARMRIVRDADSTTLIVYPYSLWIAGLAASGAASLLIVLVTSLIFDQYTMTMIQIVPWIVFVPLAYGCACYVSKLNAKRIKINSREQSVTVQIPGKAPVVFRFEDIVDIFTVTSNGQGSSDSLSRFEASIRFQRPDGEHECVAIRSGINALYFGSYRVESEWIVTWLRTTLGDHLKKK